MQSPGFKSQHCKDLAWWHVPEIPTFGAEARGPGVQSHPWLFNLRRSSLNKWISKQTNIAPTGKPGDTENSWTDRTHLTVPLEYCGGVLFCHRHPQIRRFTAPCMGVCRCLSESRYSLWVLVTLIEFQSFPLLLYLSHWSGISDLWSYCRCFGVLQTVPTSGWGVTR